jgi:hypothetical protein
MAEAWVTITEDEVLDSLTKRERDDFAKVSVAEDRPDRLPGIIADHIAEVRGFIATWSQNTLSADATTIPQSFRARSLAIIRWRTLITVPNYDPGEPRKLEWQAAEKFFQDVAAGKIRPQPAPDAVATDVPDEKPVPVPKIKSRRRLFTRETQDGI